MYMLIRYPVGIIVEAVVLAQGRNRMRVAAAGFPDAIELKRSGSNWFMAHQQVEFDFVMSNMTEAVASVKPDGLAALAASPQ